MEPRNWIVLCLLLSIIGTLLQVASYVAPMWLWIQMDSFYLGIGLWYYVGCSSNCVLSVTGEPHFSLIPTTYYSRWEWNVFRGVESAAVIGAILVCVFLTVILASWKNAKSVKTGCVILSIITWIVILAGAIWFSAFYHGIIVYSHIKFDDPSFPWSFILSLAAMVIFFLVFIFLVCMPSLDPFIGIPVSGDSKMALTPTVTNAYNGKKYYTPSPYDDRRGFNDDQYSRSYIKEDHVPIQNGFTNRDFDEPLQLQNGFTNRGYDDYNPTAYRPRSYAEPPRNYNREDMSFRSNPRPVGYHSLERPNKYLTDRDFPVRQSKYPDEPVYSQYIERARPPAGGRSVLPPLDDRARYTDEVRIGASTSYIYRPYALTRY